MFNERYRCRLALVAALVVLSASDLWAQQPRQPQQPQQQPAAPAPAPQPVQPLTPTVVAVVDVQYILGAAAATRSIQEQLDRQRAAYQDEINKREADLRKQDQDLTQQRAVLAPEAFQQRRRDFESKVQDVQKEVQARKGQLDQAFADSMGKVREQLLGVVSELAREVKADMVIAKNAIYLVEPRNDLTREALARLDRKFPSMRVTLPPLK
jgi:Skp family chaperone for outer membrane proteins